MYHFELVNTRTGETGEMTLPEELTIEDFCRELRGEMGLPYTLGSRDHLMIDNQNRGHRESYNDAVDGRG